MGAVLTALLFLFPVYSHSENIQLEIPQIVSMYTAINEGRTISWKGDTFPKTACGILWQESKAGWSKYRKDGYIIGDEWKSIGPMQVQVRTARWIGKKYPDLFIYKFGKLEYDVSDRQIKKALMKDEVWNIKVGVRYFKFLLEYLNDYNTAILAYNRGPTGALDGSDPNDYINKVKRAMKNECSDFLKGEFRAK